MTQGWTPGGRPCSQTCCRIEGKGAARQVACPPFVPPSWLPPWPGPAFQARGTSVNKHNSGPGRVEAAYRLHGALHWGQTAVKGSGDGVVAFQAGRLGRPQAEGTAQTSPGENLSEDSAAGEGPAPAV